MMQNRETQGRISGQAWLAVCAMLIALAFGGCSAKNPQIESERVASASPKMSPEQCAANASIEEAAAQDSDYRIQRGDQLALDFYMNPEFNDTATVNPDGKIALRLVGAIQAAGLTADQLAASLDKAYSSELRNPGASVHLKNMPGRKVYVEGQVNKPGAFQLQPGMTAVQALAMAGGVTDNADPETSVLIRRDACGQQQGSKIDLASAEKEPGSGTDVTLMPRDVIVVPRSRIANVDLWVKQHIRDVLPVEPYLSPGF